MLGVLSPATPAMADCKPQGIPDYAGSGQPGMIDAKTAEPSGGNLYGEYGWSGLRWNNCDIRDFGSPVDDLRAQFDTWVGDALMGLATLEGSVMTSMHKWTADPTTTLKPIDDKLVDLSTITKSLLFDNWAFPVIVFAVMGIMVGAWTKKIRPAIMTIGATALALGFVSFVGAAPLTIAQSTDGIASSIVSAADAQALKYSGIPGPGESAEDGKHIISASPAEATGAILNDAMLAPLWRQGQTGTGAWTDSTQDMFKASTATWEEVANGYNPDDKKNAYNDAVNQVKNNKETAGQYQAIKGQTYNRAGMGFMAALMMSIIAAIRIPAEALMFLGMLVIRFIPIFGPLFALMAIPEVTRGAATSALKICLAAVFNVVVFGVIASVHTAITAILYVNTANLFVSTIISAIVTYLFWKLSKPFRSITKLATGKAVVEQLENAPSAPGQAAMKGVGFLTGTAVSYGAGALGAGKNNAKDNKREKLTITEPAHPGPERKKATAATDVPTSQRPNWAKPSGHVPGQNNFTPDGPIRALDAANGDTIKALEMHRGWKEAPSISADWAKAPTGASAEEMESNIHGGGSADDYNTFTPLEAPVLQRVAASEVTVLTEPEFIGGTMVTHIFVPETETENWITETDNTATAEPGRTTKA